MSDNVCIRGQIITDVYIGPSQNGDNIIKFVLSPYNTSDNDSINIIGSLSNNNLSNELFDNLFIGQNVLVTGKLYLKEFCNEKDNTFHYSIPEIKLQKIEILKIIKEYNFV